MSLEEQNTEEVQAAPTAASPDLLGERLLAKKMISQEDLDKALSFQRSFGGRLGGIFIRIGALSEADLLSTLSEQLGLPIIPKEKIPVDPNAFLGIAERCKISADWMVDQGVIGWQASETQVYFIAKDPLLPAIREIISEAIPAEEQKWWLAQNQEIDRCISNLRQSIQTKTASSGSNEVSHLRELAEEAPVVELVNNTFSQAFSEGASDIHVEPGERNFMIRYRIDGVLQNKLTLPRERFDAVASRIKLISGIDIAERRLPQDGRIALRISGEDLDVRVSSLPAIWGESIVMRLLPKERKAFELGIIGLEEDNLETFRRWINEPYGIVLVTGPTGSGKSTTLYSALTELNTGSDKIITIEDPVEFNITGISQVQVHSEIDFTFARALRAILRQDPDTVMIGEIRDLETAEIAIQAALTGHLVLSTLHTNDALSAFTRLTDMGVEPFLVASAVRGVEAQRLVRKLCPNCAELSEPPQPTILKEIQHIKDTHQVFKQGPEWKQAVGCKECQGIGYKGRMGIYEFADVNTEIQDAIMGQRPAGEIKKIAQKTGYRTLRQDGLIKAYRGLTSIDEVLRVTGVMGDLSED